jgi:Mg/Co/Ni transporter MgtE
LPDVAVGGFARVYVSEGSLLDSFAISTSLFCIVMTSVLTGTVLPFGLAMIGVDPANAGTTIQVSFGLNLDHFLSVLSVLMTPAANHVNQFQLDWSLREHACVIGTAGVV